MLAEAFRRADWELCGPMASHKINLQYSGTTVNMGMFSNNRRYMYCANVGDSRAVLASMRGLDVPLGTRETVVPLP